MRTLGYVAVNVFRESVRDKVLYNLVVFAVLLMAASYLIGQLTAGQDIKIIKDLGLAAIATFGLMIAVFIGIGLVWKEVERRSIYALLTKPISRAQFIVGKYFGLVLTLAVNVVVMVVAWYAVLATWAPPEPGGSRRLGGPGHGSDDAEGGAADFRRADARDRRGALLLDVLQPLSSAGLTVGLWVIGHFNADLRNFEAVVESPRRRGWRAGCITCSRISRRST